MRERHPDRPDVAASKLAQNAHNDRHQELSPLPAQRPRQTDETDLDDEALRSCSQFQTRSLVGDPGIAVKERQGFAEVFRGGHGIEDDPRITRIGLLGQMKTESGVLDRFRGAIEEPALSHRRYAMMEGTALRQVALRYACVAQHRGGRDVTPPQGVDRLLGRKPHRCRQALRGRVLGHVNAPRCHEQNGINSGMADKGKTRHAERQFGSQNLRAGRDPDAIEPTTLRPLGF